MELLLYEFCVYLVHSNIRVSMKSPCNLYTIYMYIYIDFIFWLNKSSWHVHMKYVLEKHIHDMKASIYIIVKCIHKTHSLIYVEKRSLSRIFHNVLENVIFFHENLNLLWNIFSSTSFQLPYSTILQTPNKPATAIVFSFILSPNIYQTMRNVHKANLILQF